MFGRFSLLLPVSSPLPSRSHAASASTSRTVACMGPSIRGSLPWIAGAAGTDREPRDIRRCRGRSRRGASMSEVSDAWTPGRDETPGAVAAAVPSEPGALPDVMKLFSATLEDLIKHFVDYLLAGLGVMIPAFVITFGLVIGALFLGAVPMVLGAALDEPEIGSLAS